MLTAAETGEARAIIKEVIKVSSVPIEKGLARALKKKKLEKKS